MKLLSYNCCGLASPEKKLPFQRLLSTKMVDVKHGNSPIWPPSHSMTRAMEVATDALSSDMPLSTTWSFNFTTSCLFFTSSSIDQNDIAHSCPNPHSLACTLEPPPDFLMYALILLGGEFPYPIQLLWEGVSLSHLPTHISILIIASCYDWHWNHIPSHHCVTSSGSTLLSL